VGGDRSDSKCKSAKGMKGHDSGREDDLVGWASPGSVQQVSLGLGERKPGNVHEVCSRGWIWGLTGCSGSPTLAQ
jgi:hypothetical protein